jgi:hypothetical protein
MKEKVKMAVFPLLVATLLTSSCASIGPTTVARDRFDYTAAISDSWKNQMLLNTITAG